MRSGVALTNLPRWLIWARELSTIAQAGLAYSGDAFDRERFERVRGIAAEIVAAGTDGDLDAVLDTMRRDPGYVTPKVDVRAAVFDERGAILLVREHSDGCWSLPGGWADVGQSGAEVAVREVLEESGYAVRAVKLLAVLDRAKHGHPRGLWHSYKMFFRCIVTGGAARTSNETTAVDWFFRDALPPLSASRNTAEQLARMFAHYDAPELPADFD